jgi:xylan 1,4-beta-xylosidase
MMRTYFCLIFLCLTAIAHSADSRSPTAHFSWFTYAGEDPVFATPPKPGYFQNPIVAGFYPDPSITRAGDRFYMVHSSFSYFPGVPIFTSTDLVNWQAIGHVLTRPEQLPLEGAGVSRGIFAPAIRFHDGVFYMITTLVDTRGNFIVTATDPAGPWSDPILLPEIDGIDPSLFFDDDGRVYITHNGPPPGEPLYDGHRAIWMWEYDPKNRKVKPDSQRLLVNGGVDLSRRPVWIEAPHIYKVDGWYYLFCAEGGTADNHSEVVFRTRNLAEPFVSHPANPILTQRDLDPGRRDPIATAGHADIVQTPAGEWWAVFLATRNYERDFFNTGRETFLLPLTWKDGWPYMLPAGEAIPWQLPAPKGLPPTPNAQPTTGNFQWRDDFTGPRLDFAWNLLRTAAQVPYSFKSGGGLSLQARPVSLADVVQPAFLGRRQQHLTYSASTRLELPLQTGMIAGITAFQSELAHYFLGVENTGNDRYQLLLEHADQHKPTAVLGKTLQLEGGHVDLKIDGDKGAISFYYRREGDNQWRVFAENLDAKPLSTQRAGGFVGSYLGVHARITAPAPGK